MNVKRLPLYLLSDFFVLKESMEEFRAEKPEEAVELSVQIDYNGKPILVDVRKFGKIPIITVKDKNGKPIAVFDNDYRLWLDREVYENLSDIDIAEIVEAFFSSMSDDEFVKKVILEKFKKLGVEDFEKRKIGRSVKNVVKYYSKANETVSRVLGEYKAVITELNETVRFLPGYCDEEDDEPIFVGVEEPDNVVNVEHDEGNGADDVDDEAIDLVDEVITNDVITFDDLT